MLDDNVIEELAEEAWRNFGVANWTSARGGRLGAGAGTGGRAATDGSRGSPTEGSAVTAASAIWPPRSFALPSSLT